MNLAQLFHSEKERQREREQKSLSAEVVEWRTVAIAGNKEQILYITPHTLLLSYSTVCECSQSFFELHRRVARLVDCITDHDTCI